MSKLSHKLFDGVFGNVGMWSSDTMDRTAYKTMGESFPKLLELTKKNEPILASLPHELFTVTTKDGLKIVGHFFTNEEATDKTAICIHGYHSYGFYDFATVGLEYLNRGYNLLLITNRAWAKAKASIPVSGLRKARMHSCLLSSLRISSLTEVSSYTAAQWAVRPLACFRIKSFRMSKPSYPTALLLRYAMNSLI